MYGLGPQSRPCLDLYGSALLDPTQLSLFCLELALPGSMRGLPCLTCMDPPCLGLHGPALPGPSRAGLVWAHFRPATWLYLTILATLEEREWEGEGGLSYAVTLVDARHDRESEGVGHWVPRWLVGELEVVSWRCQTMNPPGG